MLKNFIEKKAMEWVKNWKVCHFVVPYYCHFLCVFLCKSDYFQGTKMRYFVPQFPSFVVRVDAWEMALPRWVSPQDAK